MPAPVRCGWSGRHLHLPERSRPVPAASAAETPARPSRPLPMAAAVATPTSRPPVSPAPMRPKRPSHCPPSDRSPDPQPRRADVHHGCASRKWPPPPPESEPAWQPPPHGRAATRRSPSPAGCPPVPDRRQAMPSHRRPSGGEMADPAGAAWPEAEDHANQAGSAGQPEPQACPASGCPSHPERRTACPRADQSTDPGSSGPAGPNRCGATGSSSPPFAGSGPVASADHRPAEGAPVENLPVEFTKGDTTGKTSCFRHVHDFRPRHSPLHQEQDLAKQGVPAQFFAVSSSRSPCPPISVSSG